MAKESINKANLKRFLINKHFLLLVWLVVASVGVISKYSLGTYNNYEIYTGVFDHLMAQLPIYGEYPLAYFDMNHYGIVFGILIAPFAMMPDWLGLFLWMIISTFILFRCIQCLPLERKWQSLIILLTINELYLAVAYQQFNVAAAALILLSFIYIEKRAESKAAFVIALGALVKIYGIISLAFFFFVKRKVRFTGSFILWSVVLFVLPMIFVNHEYVLAQYADWIKDIEAKNAANMFSEYQNISLLGVFRKISGVSSYSDIWIIASGVVLFLLSYLRVKQYCNLDFRMMMLASILIFISIFSSGSESCSYIPAMIGVGIWWAISPLGKSRTAWVLLVLVVFASFAGNILPRDIYVDYFRAYALKALPFTFVWLRISYEMLTCDFKKDDSKLGTDKNVNSKYDLNSCDIDVVLPCYNPSTDWVEVVAQRFNELKDSCPGHRLRLIITNDGSHENFDNSHVRKLRKLVDGAKIIDYKVNMGKGAALRRGVLAATSQLVIYTDIDFPYRTECVKDMIAELESGSCDIVISKRNETYHNELSFVRRILSLASRTMNSKLLGMKYPDAQGGLKGFNRVGREIFLQTTIERFLFDTEFVYKASQRDDIRLKQITVNLRDNIDLPSMGLKTMRREFINFLKIMFNN